MTLEIFASVSSRFKLKQGKKQRDLVQSKLVQIFLMYSGGYAVTGDHKMLLFLPTLFYLP